MKRAISPKKNTVRRYVSSDNVYQRFGPITLDHPAVSLWRKDQCFFEDHVALVDRACSNHICLVTFAGCGTPRCSKLGDCITSSCIRLTRMMGFGCDLACLLTLLWMSSTTLLSGSVHNSPRNHFNPAAHEWLKPSFSKYMCKRRIGEFRAIAKSSHTCLAPAERNRLASLSLVECS